MKFGFNFEILIQDKMVGRCHRTLLQECDFKFLKVFALIAS